MEQLFHTYWGEFVSIFGANFLNVLTPGLGCAIIMRNTLCYSRAMGLMTVAGMTASTAIHKTYILAGRYYLLQWSGVLFFWVKVLGCAYITYLAVQCFLRPSKLSKVLEANQDAGGGEILPQTLWQGFRQGFLTDLINPQASLVFFSISMGISEGTPLFVQAFYAVPMVASAFLWHAFLVYCASIEGIAGWAHRWRVWLDRLTGVFFASIVVRVIGNDWRTLWHMAVNQF